MTKPFDAETLSDLFDEDLIWRRKELSDIKFAAKQADREAKRALLRATITMGYAHWEGHVRYCANKYFQFISMRKRPYAELERQIYVNAFLARVDAISQQRPDLLARCSLINDIIDGFSGRFSYINPKLIETKSNLNTDVIKEICLICAVDSGYFEKNRFFIDSIILKRRNAIAHGQQEFIEEGELDDLVANVLALMQHFRGLLENKIHTKNYAVGGPCSVPAPRPGC